MEGMLQGGIGAAVALAVLAVAFFVIRGRYLAPLAAAINLSSVRFLSLELCLLLLAGRHAGRVSGRPGRLGRRT